MKQLEKNENLFYSFEDFEIGKKGIYEQVKNNKYDGVFCIMRGGFYLADYIARKLKITRYYLEISSYRAGKFQEGFIFGDMPSHEIRGNYLICDDIHDTGKTIQYIRNKYNVCSFDQAVLVYRLTHKNLDYDCMNHITLDTNQWVDFWWEI
jgi:hypoxanthine phosphoribosyltransferase